MFNYDKIPSELKNEKRWVLFRLKKLEDGRTSKLPVDAQTGYGAKSNDSDTWVSFEYALNKIDYYNCDGLGFMLGGGYFGVDIDHELENEELIDEFVNRLNSYTEISQSGTGIHIICKGTLPIGARRKGHIEMYDNARFFALTGNVIGEHNEIIDRTEEIKVLWEKYLNPLPPKPSENAYVFEREKSKALMPANLSTSEVIQKARESKNGATFTSLYYGQWEGLYTSQSEADMSFCMMLAFWTCKNAEQMDDIFRSSKLYRDKWDVKRGAKTYGERTIENAIEKCTDIYEIPVDEKPVFSSSSGSSSINKNYDLNDTGNAQRFIDRFGESIRYNFDNKYWVIWDGKTWVADVKQIVKSKVDIMIEEMKQEIVNEKDSKYAMEMFKNVKHLSSNSGKEAMLKEAMHIGDTATTNADYDKDPYLLNCANGIVELKTGRLIPHDRRFMMSKNTNIKCELNGNHPIWDKCLQDIFKKSPKLIEFVQKAIGYSLTGDTKEQCFFQCYGNGSNGKSVFLNTMYNIFGDYVLNAQVESILTRGKSNGGANSDIARMNGARFVRTNEPSEGSRFNEGLVKQLTGGDVVTARHLYGKEFEFTPVFKLWIACNYKIAVRGTDKGIWRRMRLIPFEATFEGKNADKNIEYKLQQELPSILGWAVKGCLMWQKTGLEMPDEVEQATKEYRDEMDIVQSFINECLIDAPRQREKASDVFKAYREWAKNGNEYVMTQSKFGIEMGKRFKKKNIGGYIHYLGFMLKEHDTRYIFSKDE